MTKIAKDEMPGDSSRRLSWREIILVPSFVVGIFFAVFAFSRWRDPSRDLERSHLYKVAFSHPAIATITGAVTDASFLLIPKEERRFLTKSVPEDWKRTKESDFVNGTARMMVLGKVDGDIFTISYRYTLSSDSFVVINIASFGQRRNGGGTVHSH